jgi:son of sevenless-like protein
VECLDKRWNKAEGDGRGRAPNVRSVIHTANVLSGWVSQMCLSDKDPKSRASIMKYFIATAMVSDSFFVHGRAANTNIGIEES